MIRRSRVIRTLAAISISLLCLTGCGSDGDNSLKAVKKAGFIRVAMDPGYPPFSYYNARQELVGFDVDVAREIARRLGVEAKLVAIPWQDIIKGLNAGEYEAILGSMAITDERKKVVEFSEPYYYARSQVFVLTGSALKGLDEVKARTVGVLGGDSTFENDARTLGVKRIKEYKTNDDALAALKKREVDAVITDDVVGMYAKNRMGLSIEGLGDTLGRDSIAIAVRKGNRALLKAINASLQEMRKDDTLRRLGERMASNKYGDPGQ